MSSAQVNAEKLRICWGVKRGRRLGCGVEVSDPRVVDEVVRLINEFINRVGRHGTVLLSGSMTPFDYAVNALGNWLSGIAVGNGDDAIAMLRNAEREVGKEMLELLGKAREVWLSSYRRELEDLINKLQGREATIIISGDPFNESKSFAAHLYTENLAIEVARVAKSGTITINISLTSLEGANVAVLRLFSDNTLKAMQYGLLLTDGAVHEVGYPETRTHQLWQAIAWPIAWPGKNYMYISGLGLNNDVKVTWRLIAIDHKDTFESKAEVAKEAGGLGDDEFPLFLLFAVLGDGNVNVKKRLIRLYMGYSKLELWGDLIKRLEGLGFRKEDEGHKVAYVVWTSKAVELARKMLSNPIIKAIIEDLARLPDSEKLGRLIELTSMETRSLGRSMVEVVVGVFMNVRVNNNGTVELRAWRRGLEDAETIRRKLKEAGYDAWLRPLRDGFEVYVSMYEIEGDKELTAKICEVLRKMLEETTNKGKTRRAQSITMAMKRLNCQ